MVPFRENSLNTDVICTIAIKYHVDVHHMVVLTPVWHYHFLEHQLSYMKRHTCQQNAFSVRDTHNNKPNRTVYMSPTTTNQTTQCTCHPQQRNKLYSIDIDNKPSSTRNNLFMGNVLNENTRFFRRLKYSNYNQIVHFSLWIFDLMTILIFKFKYTN